MNRKLLYFLFSIGLALFMFSCEKDDDDSNSGSTTANAPVVPQCIDVVINGDQVSFSTSCSVPDDRFTWITGDGATYSTETATHLYSDTGVFRVELRLTKPVTYSFTSHFRDIEIEPLCKICQCRFPTDTTDSFLKQCDTKTKVESWCSTSCLSNQYCNNCSTE